MAERKIIKANSTKKQEIAEEKARKTSPKVDLKAQERLAEILNDSPRLVTLNGTEWEVKALRMGTQWLIAQKCIQVAKVESANFGDIVKQFAVNIPAVVEVLVLALLNDKNKIFEDGDESDGFSELYKSTYDTLMWDCKVEEFGNIFLEVLQLIDVSFFMESHRILEIFRESTMARKRMIPEQK
jgi:hypothetical protein